MTTLFWLSNFWWWLKTLPCCFQCSPHPSFSYLINYSLIMVPNQNLQIHNTFTFGSLLPTLACPYCLRHFHSKGGHTKHIWARHPEEGSDAHGPNLSVLLLPMHSQPSSSIPSDMIPLWSPLQSLLQLPPNSFPPDMVLPPSHKRPDSTRPNNKTPFFDLGHAPPGPYPTLAMKWAESPRLGVELVTSMFLTLHMLHMFIIASLTVSQAFKKNTY